ncbi:MAG: metallophosphoesterase [Firmicutes bacterium]|nr:metallophosphoesterase [Bacillota bacterium]
MNDFENIYLTGDTHGDFDELILKSTRYGFTKQDLLIILGDVGINYFGDYRDNLHKYLLKMIPCTILCIHGNHEMRPTSPDISHKYKNIEWMGDSAYVEDEYPRFIMSDEGARYKINGREFLVIGGAYSVDKYWRLEHGYNWFSDEQLTPEEMKIIRQKVKEHNNREDIILAHTCPYNNRPVECFLSGIDERNVDNTMELFLQEIVDKIDYNNFFCGHWHTEKQDGKIRFLFHDIIRLEGLETQG